MDVVSSRKLQARRETILIILENSKFKRDVMNIDFSSTNLRFFKKKPLITSWFVALTLVLIRSG